MIADLLRDQSRKTMAVNGQAAAGFHAGSIGSGDDHAIQTAQFFLQQTNSVFQTVTAQGVGADQLRKIFGVMGRRLLLRAHFVQFYMNAALGQLPCSFRTGQTGTDYFYSSHITSPSFS